MGFNMILRFEYETPLGKQDQEKVYKEIATFEDVDTFSIYKHASFDVDEKKYLSSFGKKVLEDEMYGDLDLQLSVISLGEEEYVRYLKKLHLRNDDVKKGILIDDYLYYDKKGQLGNIYTIQDHEKLSATTSLNKELTLEIIRADERPMGLEGSYNASGYLIVSDAIMNEYFDYYLSNMFIDSKNANKLEEKIEKMQDEDQNYKHVYVNNFDEDLKANNAIVLTVSIFLYGFITVISLIGITNIFNTITTNMNLRSKEFAMLKSVGMTKKEFNRMIRLESIFYGCKALFIGIPLGLGGSYLLYKTFQGGLEFSYQIPVKALVIVFVFVSLIIGIIMRYSLHRINKQNIIETIRNDNI